MKRKFKPVIALVLCLCFAGSALAYTGSRVFTDTFDGPDMTNWDHLNENYQGEFVGGEFVITDAEGIIRYIDEGPYTAIVDVNDINLATGDFAAGDAGYFTIYLIDASYRLHVSIVNANDGTGDYMAFLGDRGSGYELWSNNPVGELETLTVKYTWDPAANTISVWADVNGAGMVNYVDKQASHTLGNGVMLEQISAAEYYGSGNNTPDSPSFAVTHYQIVGPQVTIAEGDGLEVDEEGPTFDTYDVVLETEPNDVVTITVDPDGQTEVNSSGADNPIQLTFTTTDWFTPQTVTVTAIDDTDQEGTPHIGTIIHTASSPGDAYYNGVQIASVDVTILDNEHWCGEPGTVYYDADINKDCYINLADLAELAAVWMKCTDPFDPVNCDLVLE